MNERLRGRIGGKRAIFTKPTTKNSTSPPTAFTRYTTPSSAPDDCTLRPLHRSRSTKCATFDTLSEELYSAEHKCLIAALYCATEMTRIVSVLPTASATGTHRIAYPPTGSPTACVSRVRPSRPGNLMYGSSNPVETYYSTLYRCTFAHKEVDSRGSLDIRPMPVNFVAGRPGCDRLALHLCWLLRLDRTSGRSGRGIPSR